jgi:hypothetical protein
MERYERLAIVDLDGVVVNANERFASAADQANARYDKERETKAWNDLYWRTALSAEHVHLDTLIEGATHHLYRLAHLSGYQVIYLTSRPESMREVTEAWLTLHTVNRLHHLPTDHHPLVMKHPIFQYMKTVHWKTAMICHLGTLFQAKEVLVVDDEESFLLDLLSVEATFPFSLRCYMSLACEKQVGLSSYDDEENDEGDWSEPK